MSGPIKTTTTTFLTHVGFTLVAAAAFAGLDYVANHGAINWQQLIILISGAMIVAFLHALKTFYQSQGDQTASDMADQLGAAIGTFEQHLLRLQVAPPPPSHVPPDPRTPTVPLAPAPIAPRFSLPASLNRPAYLPSLERVPPPSPKSNDAPPLFTLTGPDMDERLAQFPFPFRPPEK